MLIVTILAASPFMALPAILPALPTAPIAVTVTARADISPKLVSGALNETSAIWRMAGVVIASPRSGLSAGGLNVHVIIAGGASPWTNDAVSLGWITFHDDAPDSEIYLSYENAVDLLMKARVSSGNAGTMAPLQRETYLARALGRALAHEFGHYLLGSQLHTKTGLMKARHTSVDLFGPGRDQFGLDREQREQLASRLWERTRLARR